MHYYQFHIGDYASHTRHLSLMEDLAYRRLLDFYYLHEQPIKQRDIARQIGMKDHEQDVLTVLSEFFLSTDAGFVSPRANKEIEQYKEYQEAGKRGAAKRWAKDSPPIATLCPPYSPPNAPPIATNNHKPLTNNQVERASPNGSRLPLDWAMPEDYEAFCLAERPDLSPREVAKRFADYWHGVAGQKGRKADWLATWRNWVRNEKKQLQSGFVAVTTPAKQGPDPALAKIIADGLNAAKPTDDVRRKMKELTGK